MSDLPGDLSLQRRWTQQAVETEADLNAIFGHGQETFSWWFRRNHPALRWFGVDRGVGLVDDCNVERSLGISQTDGTVGPMLCSISMGSSGRRKLSVHCHERVHKCLWNLFNRHVGNGSIGLVVHPNLRRSRRVDESSV